MNTNFTAFNDLSLCPSNEKSTAPEAITPFAGTLVLNLHGEPIYRFQSGLIIQ